MSYEALIQAIPPSALTGGTGELISSYYVYTYVNDCGWESAPSPVSTENNRPSDAHATLSGFALPPAGNYQINRMRIYRTATGSSGATDFFFLREIANGTQSTTDYLRDLGEVCPTVAWAMPPENLTHLSALWNGMLAGISGNSFRFYDSRRSLLNCQSGRTSSC